MQFFIDTANLKEIQTALDWGLCDGITTNPSLVAKEGKEFEPLVREILRLVPGPVSLEVVGTDAATMLREARHLRELGKNAVIKIPMTTEGLKATKVLSGEGTKVNMTLCFSPLQALCAAKAGAAYISPFVGRLDDVSTYGMELIEQIVEIYNNYDYETKVLVASVRNPLHVVDAARMGAHVCTIPFNVLANFVKHPLTDVGLQKFLEDWKKVPGQK